ncbi:MAG: hypothetical protein LBK62_04055 [Treponema sp.]|jgi:hypothetical protein|nr:hypothetical protein [Treponema sp.]
MVHKDETLSGYVLFIAKVREFEGRLSGGKNPADVSREDRKAIIETAITRAVQWCIGNNILKEFLERNSSEVINMLFDEWKLEDALVVEREEGREEVAKNALGEGVSVEIIQKITGLSTETIQSLANR